MTARTVPYLGATSLSIVLLAFLVGCGGVGDGYTGPRGNVSGTVTFQGKSVPTGSTVMFQSKEGETYLALGAVKADGKYELAYEGGKELPAITYVVQITPPAGEAGADKSKAPDPKDPKTAMSGVDVKKLMAGDKDAKTPFPKKYYSFSTSKLTFEVKGGPNTADFKLEE